MEDWELQVAVCDDLYSERLELARMVRTYFQRRGRQAAVVTYASGGELLSALRPGRYHIIFLDIFMNRLSGLETARRIRQQDMECCLIFATTSRDHGVDSYEFRASDYLLKPINQSDVDSALDWCVAALAERLRGIELCSERERVRVPLHEILYIEIHAHMALAYTERRCIPTRRSLDELEKEIASPDFLRCHRSFLVNMQHIVRLEDLEICLTNGSRVPIAQAGVSKVRQQFMEWSFIKAWESR